MATRLQKEDILNAARAMSKEERLRLIAEIASLPEKSNYENISPQKVTDDSGQFDEEVMAVSRRVMDQYDNLFRWLAEWQPDTSQKNK